MAVTNYNGIAKVIGRSKPTAGSANARKPASQPADAGIDLDNTDARRDALQAASLRRLIESSLDSGENRFGDNISEMEFNALTKTGMARDKAIKFVQDKLMNIQRRLDAEAQKRPAVDQPQGGSLPEEIMAVIKSKGFAAPNLGLGEDDLSMLKKMSPQAAMEWLNEREADAQRGIKEVPRIKGDEGIYRGLNKEIKRSIKQQAMDETIDDAEAREESGGTVGPPDSHQRGRDRNLLLLKKKNR